MNRKEFLARNAKDAPATKVREDDRFAIHSNADYIRALEAIDEYVYGDVFEEYTEEDFVAFDRNFDWMVGRLTGDLDEDGLSEVDRTVAWMRENGWRWLDEIVTPRMFMDTVRSLYETCVSSGKPRYSASTGGIDVSTDLYRHSIEMVFGTVLESWSSDDGDERGGEELYFLSDKNS